MPRIPKTDSADPAQEFMMGRNWSIGVTLLFLVVACGCRFPGRRGPVSRDLATCRQFSQQGVAAMEQAQWAEAEQLLAKAVRSCPSDTEARRHYAEALWYRGARAEAISQLQEAALAVAADANLQVRLAQMHLAMGHLQQARAHAEAALDLDPKLATTWAMRARVVRASGENRQALADYHRALGFAPNDRAILLEVAQLYRELGDPQQALSLVHTLLDTYSPGEEPQEALHAQGLAYMELERFEDATESFAAATMREQPNAAILARLAEAELLSGRSEAAEAAVRQALALDPGHQPSLDLLGRLNLAAQPQAPRR